MKTYELKVTIRAENMSDLKERLEDDQENPIDEFFIDSVKEIEDE